MQDKTTHILALLDSNKLQKRNLEEYLYLTQHSLDLAMSNLTSAAELVGTFKKVAVDQGCEKTSEFELCDYIEEVFRSLAPELNREEIATQVHTDSLIHVYSAPSVFY